MKRNCLKYTAFFLAIELILYCIWVTKIIDTSSYQVPNAEKYHVLFDDAMISMRYAQNFLNGHGLVWNDGELVEGYTNFLWVLWMASMLKLFGNIYSTIAVQISGVALIIGASVISFFTFKPRDIAIDCNTAIAALVSSTIILSYYPITYWSVSGMEVSLLVLLTASATFCFVRYVDDLNVKWTICVLWLGTIAYFVRPDGWLAISLQLLFMAFYGVRTKGWTRAKQLTPHICTCGLLVVAHFLLRYKYYGSWVPNTYLLKVSGHELLDRLVNGFMFVKPFLISVSIMVLFPLLAWSKLNDSAKKIVGVFYLSFALVVMYQIYVGGDPWLYWRQLTTGFYLLSFANVIALKGMLSKFRIEVPKNIFLWILLSLVIILVPNRMFSDEITLRKPPFTFEDNIHNLKIGLALKKLLGDDAVVLSFWAGVIPFYSEKKSVDPLGKTDPYIASLQVDKGLSWYGMNGVPGHDKYDLTYSLIKKQPDYIQGWVWGKQNLQEYVDDNYMMFDYDSIELCLKKNSENIRWELLKEIGKCKK